jgi:hypothetical protein
LAKYLFLTVLRILDILVRNRIQIRRSVPLTPFLIPKLIFLRNVYMYVSKKQNNFKKISESKNLFLASNHQFVLDSHKVLNTEGP